VHRRSSRFSGCIALEFTRDRLAGSSSLWNTPLFPPPPPLLFVIDVSYYCTLFPRHYSRFAHSLLFRYFILLLYNHFSCFFSTSFCREPHLLSIFTRWPTYRVFVLMRSTRQEYHAVCWWKFYFSPSPLFFCSLHLIYTDAYLLVPSVTDL